VFELLATPGRIGPLRLKNRFVQSPLHSMLADAAGHATAELITSRPRV
jgi:2,4-dienoyl-CoA reductase-like NADH-dependent reductase (Old Yellow Enzyme family)